MIEWKFYKNTKYLVSNTGLIKNSITDKILKQHINANGYYTIVISENGICKTLKPHQLVAECFLNHIPNKHTLIINHINHDRLDNNLSNLEIITMRENTNKLHIKSTSKYIGVSLQKKTNRWLSYKMINGKHTYLRTFDTEELAYLEYLKH